MFNVHVYVLSSENTIQGFKWQKNAIRIEINKAHRQKPGTNTKSTVQGNDEITAMVEPHPYLQHLFIIPEQLIRSYMHVDTYKSRYKYIW